ncbi:hypothetical protein [Sphingomonas sp. 35-24ZXX]|uniref:hypothetical protein n=1 Tax=Sphingomonas sp. 35-24ZXX TaxID=1545915 RepID=UPI000A71B1F7|nr:hypothetical protein [Sphingomonas sp. 35-24ZXX]
MKVTAAKLAPLMSLVASLPLSACLEPMADRPSLERRAVELRDRQAEAKAPPPPIATITDPALARDLAAMLALADKAEADFAIARSAAQQDAGAARGKATGSEAWSVAQTSISALDAPRRDLAELLGDLEELYVARLAKEAAGEVEPGGSDQIDQARKHVLALVESQDQVIATLKTGLGG